LDQRAAHGACLAGKKHTAAIFSRSHPSWCDAAEPQQPLSLFRQVSKATLRLGAVTIIGNATGTGGAVPQLSKNYTVRLEAQGVPKILWKYSSERGIGLLTGRALKVTRPNEFNDPFEFSPGIGKTIGVSYLRNIYRDSAMVARLGLPSLQELSGVDDDAKIRSVAKELTHISRELLNGQLDQISERYGVICLSGDPRNIMMWSQYAQNHKGLVVGLDHSRVAKMPLLPVVYSDRRVLFDGRTIIRTSKDTNVRLYEVLTRKSLAWAHEREYRMIWPLEKLDERDVEGQKWHMLPLLPEMISEVIVGVRASDDLADRLRQIIKIFGTKTRLRRAYTHARKYQLVFRDI
jgi:Protein of unknown function (DUF2971)